MYDIRIFLQLFKRVNLTIKLSEYIDHQNSLISITEVNKFIIIIFVLMVLYMYILYK